MRAVMTVGELEELLVAAFPPVTIDQGMIEEPTALWDVYPEAVHLSDLDGVTWRDVSPELLFAHPSLLVYAGDALFRAILPAYLRYLLHERARFNALPFQVAGVLTRAADPDRAAKFDRRIRPMTVEQRTAVRAVLTLLATTPPMEAPMASALETWNHL